MEIAKATRSANVRAWWRAMSASRVLAKVEVIGVKIQSLWVRSFWRP